MRHRKQEILFKNKENFRWKLELQLRNGLSLSKRQKRFPLPSLSGDYQA